MRQFPYAPDYFVDENGDIYSSFGGQFRRRKPGTDTDGYLRLRLKGKTWKVHQIVCTTYHGPRPAGCEVRHLDGNRTNNSPLNLCWGTKTENGMDTRKHGRLKGSRRARARLNELKVAFIFGMLAYGFKQWQAAELMGMPRSTISNIVRGKLWTHVPKEMAVMNCVTLIGRTGKECEMSYKDDGKCVTKVTLAVGRPGKKDVTDWFDLVAFDKTAEVLGEYVKKGDQIGIQGRIHQEKWNDKDGNARSKHSIIVDRLDLLQNKKDNDQ